jgi:hypothetical protein
MALVAVAFVLAVAVAGVGWMFAGGEDGASTVVGRANIVGAIAGVLAVVAVAGGALRWAARPPADASLSAPAMLATAADRLAETVTATWQEQVRRRRIVTPAPATVRWRWAESDLASPREHVVIPPAAGAGPAPFPNVGADSEGEILSSGVVSRLHEEVYTQLPHRRLVLLGGPGAGKTAAMILLLLAVLDHRVRLRGEQRASAPVPVWLTLGGWDPARRSLHQWARDTLNRDHPYLRASEYGPDAAGGLLRARRVSLFLDGLDEMPEQARARALERLRDEAGGLCVVMTAAPASSVTRSPPGGWTMPRSSSCARYVPGRPAPICSATSQARSVPAGSRSAPTSRPTPPASRPAPWTTRSPFP